MKKILVALITFVSLSAFAADEWVRISESSDKAYIVEGKKGSFIQTEKFGFITTRSKSKNKNYTFEIVSMSKEQCEMGVGNVYYYDTNLKLIDSVPYVAKGGTIAQTSGDLICALLKQSNT